jgi:hypothetical protein
MAGSDSDFDIVTFCRFRLHKPPMQQQILKSWLPGIPFFMNILLLQLATIRTTHTHTPPEDPPQIRVVSEQPD